MASARFDQQFFADVLRGLIPDLPATAASLLSRTCLLQKYVAGDVIVREGELTNGIFLLIFGAVQASVSDGTTSAKKQVRLHQIQAPAVLGIAGSMLAQASPVTITAITSVEAAFISQSHLGNVLKDSPQAGLAFSHLLAHELACTYEHLGQLRCTEPTGAVSQLN